MAEHARVAFLLYLSIARTAQRHLGSSRLIMSALTARKLQRHTDVADAAPLRPPSCPWLPRPSCGSQIRGELAPTLCDVTLSHPQRVRRRCPSSELACAGLRGGEGGTLASSSMRVRRAWQQRLRRDKLAARQARCPHAR